MPPGDFVEFLKVDKEALRNYLASLGYTAEDVGGFNYLAFPNERIAQFPSMAEFLSGLD